MGSIFVTKADDSEPEDLEGVSPFAEVPWLGDYLFLYPGVLELQAATGQKLHAAERAFFTGPDLEPRSFCCRMGGPCPRSA